MKKAVDKRTLSTVNNFNGTALGKALAKGLDEHAFTYLVTCINPLKEDEPTTTKVLDYSASFHKVAKKQPLATPLQLATLEHLKQKEIVN